MFQSLITEIRNEIATHMRWLVQAIINTTILALWAFFHYLLNKYAFSQLLFVDVDAFIFRTLQYLGAVSTLLPILIHTVKDLVIMIIKSYDEIMTILSMRRNASIS